MMDNFWDGPLPKPGERTVEDMRCVLADKSATAEKILYFMYRDLSKSSEDKKWLSDNKLRYDITVIPPCILGREYVKTKGHYHPDAPCGLGYPELYQVISGEAHFLLQRKDLSDIYAVKAKAGDIVIIKPGYGHVTINPGDETLIMANIVSDGFESEYDSYTKMHGAAYYEFTGGEFVKNPYYGNLPQIKIMNSAKFPIQGIYGKKSIYDLIGDEVLLEFLNNPSVLKNIL